ncbi:hypothetical protein F5884DRAFT_758481 [Xylogone sp. PMI_703]|nr:hypothetical protein F5884DRAFT_758481 [Xylogone sp. PMI_703]
MAKLASGATYNRKRKTFSSSTLNEKRLRSSQLAPRDESILDEADLGVSRAARDADPRLSSADRGAASESSTARQDPGLGTSTAGQDAAPRTSSGGDDKSSVLGLDHGSILSAMAIRTKDRGITNVDCYPDEPPSHYDGSIPQVQSEVTVIVQKGVPIYFCGFEARTHVGITFTCLKLMIDLEYGDPDEHKEMREKNRQKLKTLNKKLETPITFDTLLRQFLEYLREHLEDWCRPNDVPLPRRTVATYPVRWERYPEVITRYQELVTAAGFKDVSMLNEAEAAANALFTDRSPEWFQVNGERGRIVTINDNGGVTYYLVVYRVRKDGDIIIKEEIWRYGGEGGMAIVLDLAAQYLAKNVTNPEQLRKCLDDLDLEMKIYPRMGKNAIQVGNLPVLITCAQIEAWFEEGLKQILEVVERSRVQFEALGVEEVFAVGGTSQQTKWFRPKLIEALRPLGVAFPSHPSGSPFIARGATCAADYNCVTSSRLNDLNIGHLVSRGCQQCFMNKKIWPRGDVFEVVEMFRLKGEPFVSADKAEWHWMKIEDWKCENLRDLLENMHVELFATEKQKEELGLVSHKHFHDVAPRSNFNIKFESRRVFEEPDIKNFLGFVEGNKDSKRWEYFWAIRFWCDGLGIVIEVGWRDDYTKEVWKKDKKVVAAGPEIARKKWYIRWVLDDKST